jgi:ribosomal protein L40E
MSDEHSPRAGVAAECHVCPQCAATSAIEAKFCWLCGAPVVRNEVESDPRGFDLVPASEIELAQDPVGSAPPREAAQDLRLHASIWAGVIVVAAIGWGMLLNDPILAMAYLIIAVPALLGTIVISALARGAGSPLNPASKVALAMGIAGVLVPLALFYSIYVAIMELCSMCRNQ